MTPARTVHCTDALAWLAANGTLEGASIVTSLPDVSELAMPIDAWRRWFSDAAALVLSSMPMAGVAIFYQTDIVVDGIWIDKNALVASAAERLGIPMLWHRIVCRKPAGARLFGRPGYAHLSCFSRGVRARPDIARIDVLPDGGETTWARGMGTRACLDACRFVLEHTETRTIVDPFCGHGTVLAAANALGLDAVGVELGRKRAQKARTLRLQPDGTVVTSAP